MNIINIPIEPHWHPPYRLEYDGKYISLYGRDKNYPIWYMTGEGDIPGEYDEMVLIPVVIEVRNANPRLEAFTITDIIISY